MGRPSSPLAPLDYARLVGQVSGFRCPTNWCLHRSTWSLRRDASWHSLETPGLSFPRSGVRVSPSSGLFASHGVQSELEASRILVMVPRNHAFYRHSILVVTECFVGIVDSHLFVAMTCDDLTQDLHDQVQRFSSPRCSFDVTSFGWVDVPRSFGSDRSESQTDRF